MAKKRPSPAAKSAPAGGFGRHLVKIGITLLAAAVGLAWLAWLGYRAGENVVDHPRFAVPFAEIRCEPPPGKTREVFLSEVRYLGQLPETIPAVAADLPDRLIPAFKKHPWVADVASVTVSPERAITVHVVFRQAVLAVKVKGGPPHERLVDARGFLLPVAPPPAGCAVYLNEQATPPVPAGAMWDDAGIRRAAELARDFKPASIEKTDKGWRLIRPDGRAFTVGY